MIKANLHTHTTWCDGHNTPREMADAAIAAGFHTLGFSGHSPTDFDDSFCLRDANGFAKDIKALKEEYAGRLHILLGVEYDLYGNVPYEPEYTIGAVHYVRAKGKYYAIDHTPELQHDLMNEVYGGDTLSAVSAYYDCVAEMAYRLRPDFVAHFDVIAKFNDTEKLFDEKGEAYLRIACAAVDAVMENCRIFEVNTGGIYRAYRTVPYPTQEILSYIRSVGGEVTLSSDSHNAKSIDYGFVSALDIIANAGFETIRVMTPTGWGKISLFDARRGYAEKRDS